MVDLAQLYSLGQAVGIHVGFFEERLAQFVGEIFEELAFAFQTLGLVFLKAGKEFFVGEKPEVQHDAEKHGCQTQRVEQFDAEAPGTRVEDAQYWRQHHEDEASDEEAGTGPA